VAAAGGLDKDDIAKCYRLLLMELDLKIPVANPKEYVSRVTSKANMSQKVEADALKILSKAGRAEIRRANA
jgi:transcription initiation factor TFIIB